jgi:hypothetical protein
MRRIKVEVTTEVGGAATKLSPKVTGKVHSVHYIPDGTVPFSNTVDFAITVNGTGENVWTQSNITAGAVKYPRAPVHDQAGAALLYAAGGPAQADKIGLGNDEFKIVLAQGGDAKKGTFIFLVD